MKLRIVTAHDALARSISEVLTAAGHEVEHLNLTVSTMEMRCRSRSEYGQLPSVAPFQPAVVFDPNLEGCDAELKLGDSRPLGSWELRVHGDSDSLNNEVMEFARLLGFDEDGIRLGVQEANEMAFGGAPPFARQCIMWFLKQRGIEVRENKRWDDSDNDIWLYVLDPTYAGLPPRERYEVEVLGDDPDAVGRLAEQLEAQGFTRVTLRFMDAETARGERFAIRPGPFSRGDGVDDLGRLRTVMEATLGAAAVDPLRYPLEVEGDEDQLKARVILPLGVFVGGTMPPYDGDLTERFKVTLRTDDVAAAEGLHAALEALGFDQVRLELRFSRLLGFAIHWVGASEAFLVKDQTLAAVQAALAALPGGDEIGVLESTDADKRRSEIQIEFPAGALATGTLDRRLRAACADWECSLKTGDPAAYEELANTLRECSWKNFVTDREAVTDARIKHGGAPPTLVAWVRDLVHRATGIRCQTEKAWGDEDDDIWIYLPETQAGTTEEVPPVDLSTWLGGAGQAETAFIQVSADKVTVGDVTLPRRPNAASGLVPPAGAFTHYCIDQRTAETLSHIAWSVALREPCLLEGETSTSKTSSVLYLAHLLNQPVVRLNLNGQTDTGELIGRFLPQNLQVLPVDPEELLAGAELLEAESRMILERARGQGRPLTRLEVQQIMANEEMSSTPWRWQDGLVVSAMRRGWWVVLDELNLAEPQILERLNSVLERSPSLVLTEHDNSLVGPGGTPVHPDFRIFATMNPAEYAGRTALSPAYRDRWTGYRFVSSPGETEYLAMLRFLVSGEQPTVEVAGWRWQATAGLPPLGALADVDGIEGFLAALARFHSALESAVGRGSDRAPRLGARRKERYVFTRRGLLAVMDYLAATVAARAGSDAVREMRRALARYYVGRVASSEDQQVVVRLLDAAGIGPNTWSLEGIAPADSADDETEGEDLDGGDEPTDDLDDGDEELDEGDDFDDSDSDFDGEE